MLEDDLRIGDDLARVSVEVPLKHNKWMKFASDASYRLHKLNQERARLKKRKYEIYTGRADPKDLMTYADKDGANLNITKSEIPTYMDADEDIQELDDKIMRQEILYNRICEAVKTFQYLHLTIKNAITWHKFQAGE